MSLSLVGVEPRRSRARTSHGRGGASYRSVAFSCHDDSEVGYAPRLQSFADHDSCCSRPMRKSELWSISSVVEGAMHSRSRPRSTTYGDAFGRRPHGARSMSISALRPWEIAPGMLPASRWAAVDEVVAWPRQENQGEWPRRRLLEGGRLLADFPDADLTDGAAFVQSHGCFDQHDGPPWGTWVGYFEEAPGTTTAATSSRGFRLHFSLSPWTGSVSHARSAPGSHGRRGRPVGPADS